MDVLLDTLVKAKEKGLPSFLLCKTSSCCWRQFYFICSASFLCSKLASWFVVTYYCCIDMDREDILNKYRLESATYSGSYGSFGKLSKWMECCWCTWSCLLIRSDSVMISVTFSTYLLIRSDSVMISVTFSTYLVLLFSLCTLPFSHLLPLLQPPFSPSSQLSSSTSASFLPQLLLPFFLNFCFLSSSTSASFLPQLLLPFFLNFCFLSSLTSVFFLPHLLTHCHISFSLLFLSRIFSFAFSASSTPLPHLLFLTSSSSPPSLLLLLLSCLMYSPSFLLLLPFSFYLISHSPLIFLTAHPISLSLSSRPPSISPLHNLSHLSAAVDLYADLKGREQEHTSSHETTASSVRINSVININDIPMPTDISEKVVFQSAVFIEDGINYQSIHHRIDTASLKFYRVYYSRYVRWCLGFVIFINLMLAFVEYPTSLTLSSDIHFRKTNWHTADPHCGITESIELLCLLCFLIDCGIQMYLLGWRRFIKKPWLIVYSLMIIISFVDVGVSLSFCDTRANSSTRSLWYSIRVRRYCRPIFFLLSSSIMKKFIKAVVLTLPQIFSVLSLLLLHLYVFAMIGLLVFPRSPSYKFSNGSYPIPNPDYAMNLQPNVTLTQNNLSYSHYAQLEGKKYFSSVTQAFISLLVLLTTANHPDVMMPIYQYNRFSSIYFIVFLGIGTFLILNLLIAATYNQFKGFFQDSLQGSFFRRRVAFRAAFTLLAKKTHQLQQKGGSRLCYVQEVVSKDFVRRLLQKARIPRKLVPQMYTKLETMTSSHCLNWQQFKDVFDLVSKEPTKTHRERMPYYGRFRWLQWVQLIIRHRFFSYFTYVLSIINVLLITIELQISYENALERADSRLAYYNLVFVLYYILEQTLKLIGYGLKGYFQSFGNVYEGSLTLILVVIEIMVISCSKGAFATHSNRNNLFHYATAIRVMNIVIVFRLLRIVAHVQRLRILISIIIDLFKNLRGFAGLMVIIYYIFALLGMSLFPDVDGESQKLDEDTGDSWSNTCGTFDNLNYYANNFHDFGSSVVTLWDVMVVNNWYVFLEKYARDSLLKSWSSIYFIAWWLMATIIGTNLFVSLVLDTFLIRWDAVHGSRDDDEGNVNARELLTNSGNWDITASREQMVSVVVVKCFSSEGYELLTEYFYLCGIAKSCLL